jgi:hypothetical protein
VRKEKAVTYEYKHAAPRDDLEKEGDRLTDNLPAQKRPALLIALATASLLALAICLVFVLGEAMENTSVQSSVSRDLNAIRRIDYETLRLLGDQLAIGEQFGLSPKEVASILLEGYTYSIDSIEEEGEIAEVEISVTSRQLASVSVEILPEIARIMNNSQYEGRDIQEQYALAGEVLLEALRRQPLTTQTLTLTYHQSNGIWVIENRSAKDLALALAGYRS